MIRILLADDHGLVREGLKQIFALSDQIAVAGEAVNGGQVLEFLRRETVDLVLLDLTMPGTSGTDLIGRIRALDEPPYIMVLSMHNEPQVARRAIQAGAAGYLTKDSDPETLLHAVRKVGSGGRFIDPALAEQMAFESSGGGQRLPHELLTEREYQILCRLVRGMSVNDVASDLAISNKTVSTHKARLMEKMNIRSNAELIRYAVTYGLTG